MAPAFSSWEMDPFFAAAEDVQQSADRMESAYRNWIYKRTLAEEAPAAQTNVNLCNDDVATALDTTKWQLEEFTKAVTKSDTFLLGEEVSKRYFSFIEAIQNQIFLIEEALHKCIDVQFSNSSHSVKLNGHERDQLEMFLSGGASSRATDQLARDEKQHYSSLASSKTLEEPIVMGIMCDDHDSQGFHASTGSNESVVDVCKAQDRNASLEVIEAGTVPKEELIEMQIVQDRKVSIGCTNFIPVAQLIHSENAVGDSFAKLHRLKKPLSCRNDSKRWKSGNLCINVKEDATLCCCKDKPQPEIELGYGPEDPRSHRQNYLQSAGRWRQRRLLVSRYMAVCTSSGRRASFVVVLICLGCVYFWFLSSFVPYVNLMFPHSF